MVVVIALVVVVVVVVVAVVAAAAAVGDGVRSSSESLAPFLLGKRQSAPDHSAHGTSKKKQ